MSLPQSASLVAGHAVLTSHEAGAYGAAAKALPRPACVRRRQKSESREAYTLHTYTRAGVWPTLCREAQDAAPREPKSCSFCCAARRNSKFLRVRGRVLHLLLPAFVEVHNHFGRRAYVDRAGWYATTAYPVILEAV